MTTTKMRMKMIVEVMLPGKQSRSMKNSEKSELTIPVTYCSTKDSYFIFLIIAQRPLQTWACVRSLLLRSKRRGLP